MIKKVFCFGTFDILHRGHKEFFKHAKSQGDYLAVIVVPDNVVYENKARLPKNNQETRIENLKKIKIIDKVFSTSSGLKKTVDIIQKNKPHIFVLGYDQTTFAIDELKKQLKNKSINLKYHVCKEFAKGIHTSDLIY